MKRRSILAAIAAALGLRVKAKAEPKPIENPVAFGAWQDYEIAVWDGMPTGEGCSAVCPSCLAICTKDKGHEGQHGATVGAEAKYHQWACSEIPL